MTLPDKLVQMALSTRGAPCLHAPHLTCDPDEEMMHPECAIAAALTALPEWEPDQAPVWYTAEEAAAWAIGRNALKGQCEVKP